MTHTARRQKHVWPILIFPSGPAQRS